VPTSQDVAESGDLLRLAIAEPTDAEARAADLVATSSDPWVLSVAHHAQGIVLRDRGRTDEALVELRAARELARLSGDPDRLADVRATLGSALVLGGRSRSGLQELDRAVAGAVAPDVLAKTLMRRGYVLGVLLARHHEALADLRGALAGARAEGDQLWAARALTVMSALHLDVGDVDQAAVELEEARDLFESEGQELEAMQALHSQGTLAFYRGDLPSALSAYDRAAAAYSAWGVPPYQLGRDRCQALLAAGLPEDVCAVAADLLSGEGIHPVNRAELELYLALGELAGGNAEAAMVAARSARNRLRRKGREIATARAELVVLTARRRAGARGAALATTAEELARRLEQARSEDAPVAWLHAGRAAIDVHPERAGELWAAAARYRRHSSGLVRATAWLAEGLERDRRDDARGVWHACRRGLDALDHHRATLGSTELRARASVRGDELARLALTRAIDARPRTLLWWSERWRATALAQPPVRPPRDPEVASLFAMLRANERRLSEARDDDEPTATLERERARLEKSIQHRRRLVAAANGNGPVPAGVDVDRLVDEVGDATFVELVEVDGALWSVVVHGGRVQAHQVGSAAEATAAVDSARFVLRQAARGRPVRLHDLGARLQATLLGPSAAGISSGQVVVSPTAALHATPWGLLPALSDVPVTVVPTASSWLRARRSRARRAGRVLVLGPGLASGGAEVPRVAAEHPGAVVLSDGSATVDGCLRAIDGAELVHVAAHGRFRADNPMFSALDLDDGPLTVHDFERLRRAPRRFVLSACDSGVLVPVGANELLGLATALMSMGTAGILSSVAPVNDEATAELMVDVHRGLDEVDDLGVVMHRVRERARGDQVREATAAAFVPLGV
jgi:tetratricopeptide (TPR) repeat protein